MPGRKDSRVRQVSASLSGEWQRIEIMRAGGEHYSDIRPLVRHQCLGGGGAEWPPGIRQLSAAAAAAAMRPISIPPIGSAAVDEALRQALVNLESVPAPAGEMTVVLGPGWPGILLHEAIGHGLEGDFNRKKTSAFAGLLGERVAAPGVTVVDDGTIDGRRGSLSIDDEGTPTSRTVLIEDGILKGYMQDRQNARLMGMKPTGNGRRQSLCLAGDAAHDQHLHAGRRQGPEGNSGKRQERHLCGEFRRRPGGHHQRQIRLQLHRGLHDRERQAGRADQGRDPDRLRPGMPDPRLA